MNEKEPKRGYLNQEFQFFHLKDKKSQKIESHYHEFNKIIIFLSGEVTYNIEGKPYHLIPWDILLIKHHAVHRSIIETAEYYERIILWMRPEFIERYRNRGYDISRCFQAADERRTYLIRVDLEMREVLKGLIEQVEESCHSKKFASNLMAETLLLQFLVYLNRIQIEDYGVQEDKILYDKRVEEILTYINQNFTKDLTIEQIASLFFLNKYYLMHKFKEETGFTLHNYIVQKRLLLAAELMKRGESISEVCFESGFKDYSVFYRAFKKMFHKTPKEYYSLTSSGRNPPLLCNKDILNQDERKGIDILTF